MRKKAQYIILAVAVILICLYVFFEVTADIFIQGISVIPMDNNLLVQILFSFFQNIPVTVQSWGYVGVFILMLLEASSLPIPSEAVLPFAGFLIVLTGQLEIWLVIAVATTAAIIGSLIDYYIGLKGINILTDQKIFGKTIVSKSQLEKVSGWFVKYGSFTVLVARLIPVFRTLISFPAGAVKMRLSKFIVYTVAGCLVWNTALVYLGYYLGANWREVTGFAHYIVIGVVAVSAVIVGVYLFKRRKKKILMKTNQG